MPARPIRFRVVGVLSIAYGVLIVLFWAWTLGTSEAHFPIPDSGSSLLRLVLFIAAPLLLAFTGYILYSTRIAGPDARAIQITTIVILAVKAAVTGYWAIELLLERGPFSGLLNQSGFLALAFVVAPSVVWAVALALTLVPSATPPPPPAER
jgi:hypothetical protein